MAYKMKGFSGFGKSPLKQVDLTKKQGLGPRATVKKKNRKKIEKEAEEASTNVDEWMKYNPSVEGFVEREKNPKKTTHDPLVRPDDEFGNIDMTQYLETREQREKNKPEKKKN